MSYYYSDDTVDTKIKFASDTKGFIYSTEEACNLSINQTYAARTKCL